MKDTMFVSLKLDDLTNTRGEYQFHADYDFTYPEDILNILSFLDKAEKTRLDLYIWE